MDPRVVELQCIMPITNIGSVLARGILSYERVAGLAHDSVALQPVQERRDKIRVPGGLLLHQYANLYFHARNPMLFKRFSDAGNLCVLRVDVLALQLPGVVITDCNAASDYARYLAPSQWSLIDFDDVFALDWRHPGNRARYLQHRSRKCAEVLVPHRVDSAQLTGAYVVDSAAETRLRATGFALPIRIDPVLFFRNA